MKTIAEDLSANGRDSRWYGEMKSAMDADTRGTLKVTSTAIADNGRQVDMPVRLIGILHDDKADGSGKAGLTFQTVNSLPRAYCVNGIMPDDDDEKACSSSISTNKGGWRDSALRRNMNGGEIWESMPADLRDNVEPVVKMTNNTIGNSNRSASTGTSDRLWIVSYREYVKTMRDSWMDRDGSHAWSQEGSQYGFYDGRVINNDDSNAILGTLWATSSGRQAAGAIEGGSWERSSRPGGNGYFLRIFSSGDLTYYGFAHYRYGVAPAFCL